ncbi:MAG TPA: ABC transporter permease [Tepidisphaeraceae bacterium]|nr:ABC transporter permease [Tepidisphaeraceae bacterium]
MPNSATTQSMQRPGIPATFLMLPILLWLLLLVVAPTVILVVYSFCDRDEMGQVVFSFTLDNYRRIFDPDLTPVFAKAAGAGAIGAVLLAIARRTFAGARIGFVLAFSGYLSYAIRHLEEDQGTYLRIFWRSTELAAFTAILCLLIGYPVAYFVGRASPRWRNRLLAAIMIPFWTSFLIRTYAWITILNENGLLNTTLRSLHLTALIPASGGMLYTPTAVVIGLVYAYLPFMILPIYGSVEKLDDALIEASLDLGAGPLRTFTNVILPLTRPGIVAGIMLVFVPAIGMFAVTDLLGGARVPMIGNVIQNQFGQARDWPFGSALGVTLMAMFGLVFLVTGRGAAER